MARLFYKQNQCSAICKQCKTGFIIKLSSEFLITCILIHLSLQFLATWALCRLDQILIDGSVY